MLLALDMTDRQNPLLLGDVDVDGLVWDIQLSGSHAFVAAGPTGLRIVDFSNPAAMKLVGSYRDASSYSLGVALSGSRLYLADGYNGVRIFDVSVFSSPAQIGSIDTVGFARDVVVEGATAYVAHDLAVTAFDTSNAASPKQLGTVSRASTATHLAVAGSTVFAAFTAAYPDGVDYLSVFDFSNPEAPVEVRRLRTETANFAGIEGNLLVVGAADTLRLFDISTPSAPEPVWHYATATLSASFSNNTAFIATGPDGLAVFDVSHPEQKIEAAYIPTENPPSALATSAGKLLVAEPGRVRILDITSTPAAPVNLGSFSTDQRNATGIAVKGSVAFLACDSELMILDISDATKPALLAKTNLSADSVALYGDFAYLANDSSQVAILDVTDPTKPTYAGAVAESQVETLAIAGTRAYLGGEATLAVFDLSNPRQPVRLGSYATSGKVNGIRVVDNKVFVAESGHFLVLDASNPSNPTLIASVPAAAISLDLAGNFACVGDATGALRIFDIANVAQLRELAHYPIVAYPHTLTVAGSIAFIAGGTEGVVVLDVSKPSRLDEQLAAFSVPAPSTAAAIESETAWVVGGNELRAIDVSEPSSPREIDTWRSSYPIRSVAVSGQSAYVNGNWAVRLVELSDGSLMDRGLLPLGKSVNDLAVRGNYLYFTSVSPGGDMLVTFDISGSPGQAVMADFITTSCPYARLILAGNWAVLFSTTSSSVDFVDVSDPRNLPFASFHYYGRYDAAASAGDFVYLASFGEIHVLQVSPTPHLLGVIRVPRIGAGIRSLAVTGRFAYGVTADTIMTFDLADPAAPYLVSTYRKDFGIPSSVGATDTLLVVPNGDHGVGIHQTVKPHR